MSRYNGHISRRFSTGGYSCKRVKGTKTSGTWRCNKHQKAFKFAFGD